MPNSESCSHALQWLLLQKKTKEYTILLQSSFKAILAIACIVIFVLRVIHEPKKNCGSEFFYLFNLSKFGSYLF